jgi:hypothetical protein
MKPRALYVSYLAVWLALCLDPGNAIVPLQAWASESGQAQVAVIEHDGRGFPIPNSVLRLVSNTTTDSETSQTSKRRESATQAAASEVNSDADRIQYEPFCQRCQAARWASLGDQLLGRAQNLKSARALFRQAEASHREDLIQKAKAFVDRTTLEWQYVDQLATTLQSSSYKAFLARHQVDVDVRYDEARAELHRKTEQLDHFRHTLDPDKQSQLRQMQAIATEEAKQRRTLATDSGRGAIKAAAFGVDLSLRLLKSIPSGAIDWGKEIQRLERLSTLAKAIELGKIGADTLNGEYWRASVDASQVILALIIPTAITSEYKVFIASAAQSQLARLTAYPFFLTTGLNFADIGVSHLEFSDAEARLDHIDSVEANWTFDIESATSRVTNLAAERDLAADAVQRQRQIESQAAIIRAELNQ